MHRVLFIFFCLGAGVSCTPQSPTADEKSILAIMDKQVNCWNEGDLDGFMEGYLQSDSLMFIGKNGITYGYQNTLDRYHKNYPDRQTMGTLSFNILHLNRLSPEYYAMIGQWNLDRETDNLQGYFSLLFKKINSRWVIIKDHSS
ncbi:hypothetical protein OKW21_002610 [Catalinimonas alkaloidigena]|uniref:YybH family protein n=1 Tax=Catalinimonas alkaloidigena TaxID=1075417 RepID=UPI002406E07A|nr:DUF4440 domain-containing protein [Catalinimonas alkaloidigena]MDF9797347.1 hypothetical protein [Catalinimonas alkaloidigena]